MDKENKYYSLIRDLVKNHRKFPGYEAILEEIIDDVFAHSEIIINSIDNEDVIKSYLEKVISTSIITVPKKMHFNTAANHRVITPAPEKIVTTIPEVKKAESAPEPTVVEPTLAEPVTEINTVELSEPTEIQTFDEPEAELQEVTDLETELSLEPDETDIGNDTDTQDDILTFAQDIGSEKANPELVDKMINSMGNDDVEGLNDISTEPSLNDEQVEFSDLADVDELEVINEEEIEAEIPEVSEEEVDEVSFEPSEPEFEDNLAEESGETLGLQFSDEPELLGEDDSEHADELTTEADDDTEVFSPEEEFAEPADESPLVISEEGADISFSADDESEDSDSIPEFSDDLSQEEPSDIITSDEPEELNEEPEQFFAAQEEPLIEETGEDIGGNELTLDIGEPSLEPAVELMAEPAAEFAAEPELEEEPEETSIEPAEDDVVPGLMADESSIDILSEPADTEDDLLQESEDSSIGFESESLSDNNELAEFSSETEDSAIDFVEPVLAEPEGIGAADDNDFGLELQDDGLADIGNDGLELNVASDEPIGFVSDDDESHEISGGLESDEGTPATSMELHSDEYFENISLVQPTDSGAKNEPEYKPADFSVFDFAPESFQPGLNLDLLSDKLLELNQKRPELSILTIFDMKYKQDMTIDAIAAALNINTNQVIMALNKIIELV